MNKCYRCNEFAPRSPQPPTSIPPHVYSPICFLVQSQCIICIHWTYTQWFLSLPMRKENRLWHFAKFACLELLHIQMHEPGHCISYKKYMPAQRSDQSSQCILCITKTYLYYFDPLKPHFYIVKLGFTGVYIIFLFLLKNIDCGYSLEPPRRGGSNEYPQSMFWAEIWKISVFFSEHFYFLVVKFSLYLNRRVFVMVSWGCRPS